MLTRELPAYPDGYALTTRRLKLRPPNPSDADALHPLCADERLTEFLAWAPHDSPEATRQMIVALVQSQQSAQAFHWVVEADVGIVGIVSLIDVRWRHRTWTLNRAELAYWIGVPFQGRGFATEAAAEILQFAFSGLGCVKSAFSMLRIIRAQATRSASWVFDLLVKSGRLSKKLGEPTT